MADSGDATATLQLRDELQRVTTALTQEQQQRTQQRQQLASAHVRVADLQGALRASQASVAASRDACADAARVQQSLEVAQQSGSGGDGGDGGGDDDDDGALAPRETYVTALSEKDGECRALQDEIDALTGNVRDLYAAPGDAQRRLAVARLVSMLDQLRSVLEDKVHEGVDGDAEVRAQECYKTLQELTRERARALRLLQHKERALRDAVALKQRRVRELRAEACRNLGALRDANERQVLTVTERIQRERQALLSEIDKLVVTNDRLAAVLRETKVTLASSADDASIGSGGGGNNDSGRPAAATSPWLVSGTVNAQDEQHEQQQQQQQQTAQAAYTSHQAALSLREAMGSCDAADVERDRLQERIAAANVELQRLDRRTADIKARIDADTDRYTEKMTHLQAKIAVYHDEANRLEAENKELKSTCDSLAAMLQ